MRDIHDPSNPRALVRDYVLEDLVEARSKASSWDRRGLRMCPVSRSRTGRAICTGAGKEDGATATGQGIVDSSEPSRASALYKTGTAGAAYTYTEIVSLTTGIDADPNVVKRSGPWSAKQ
jgi:hypothetical protein